MFNWIKNIAAKFTFRRSKHIKRTEGIRAEIKNIKYTITKEGYSIRSFNGKTTMYRPYINKSCVFTILKNGDKLWRMKSYGISIKSGDKNYDLIAYNYHYDEDSKKTTYLVAPKDELIYWDFYYCHKHKCETFRLEYVGQNKWLYDFKF